MRRFAGVRHESHDGKTFSLNIPDKLLTIADERWQIPSIWRIALKSISVEARRPSPGVSDVEAFKSAGMVEQKRNQTIDIGSYHCPVTLATKIAISAGMDFARGRKLFDPYQI